MNKLWKVVYMYIEITGGSEQFSSEVVKANTKEEALIKFNKFAETHKGYPYYWKKATIDNVKELIPIE